MSELSPQGKQLLELAGLLGTATSKYDAAATPIAHALRDGAIQLSNRVVPVGGGAATLSKFAASKPVLNALKIVPGLGAVGGVLGAADIVAGNDSAANKTMDTVAMGIGGLLGAAGGPLGIAAGAGLGKAASDATQFIFGDKKSAEQRKLEEALAALRGGQI